MSRHEAKEILSAFRPGTEDERDPMFIEALEVAEHDSELAAWLAELQAFDSAVKRKVAVSPLASGLFERIHTGVTLRRAEGHQKRLWLMALAASLVLFLMLAGLWLYHRNFAETTQFAACRSDMVRFLQRFPRLDLETASLAQARQWLADTRHLQQVQFPAGLGRFPTIGCRTLEWHGHPLGLVCFMVDGEVVHFIVIPRNRIPDGPASAEPQFARAGGETTVAWSRRGLTYLVLSKASEGFLRERL
jgi:hypothetical protein